MRRILLIISTAIVIIMLSLWPFKKLWKLFFVNSQLNSNEIIIRGEVSQIDTLTQIVQGKFGNRLERKLLIRYQFMFNNKKNFSNDEIMLGTKYDASFLKHDLKNIKIKIDTLDPSSNSIYLE